MDEQRFAKLTARVYTLEQRLMRYERLLGANEPGDELQAKLRDELIQNHGDALAAEALLPAAAPRTIPDIPDGSSFDSVHPLNEQTALNESNFITRALLFAGIVLLFIGAAYAVQFAFANGWVSPQARILLGLAAGAALTAGAQRIRSGPYVYAAEGGLALGTGLMYLSLWAAAAVYHFIPSAVAANAMGAITLLLAALAYVRKSERIAIFGALAGLATPFWTTAAAFDTIGTAAYLLILAAVLLGSAYAARWRVLAWVLLGGVLCYTPQFADAVWPNPAQRALVLDCATLAFYAEFAVFFICAAWRAIGDAAPRSRIQWALTGFVAATGAAAGAAMVVHANDRTGLCARLLAIAALTLLAACRRDEARAVRVTLAGTSVALVTLALPSYFSGGGLTDAFTIEAAALAYAAVRIRNVRLGALAFAGLVCTLLAENVGARSGGVAIANAVFAHRALWLAAALFSIRILTPFILARAAKIGIRIAWLVVHVAVFAFIGDEFYTYASHDFAEFGISLFATAYAAAGLYWGVRTGSRFWQRCALALFGFTILKILFNDLSFVPLGLRIILLAIVGGACVAASLAYQRRRV